jgi:hypothetical protein
VHAAQQDDSRKPLNDGTEYNSHAAQLRTASTAFREDVGRPIFGRALWILSINEETRSTYRPSALAHGMLVFVLWARFGKLGIGYLAYNDVSECRTAHICKIVAMIGYRQTTLKARLLDVGIITETFDADFRVCRTTGPSGRMQVAQQDAARWCF